MHDIHLPAFEFPVPDNVEVIAPSPKTSAASFRWLQLTFPDIPLYPRQIAQWRGAIAEQALTLPGGSDLFHNHAPESDATLHRPTLIQYRCKEGRAQIWAFNEGADALMQLQPTLPLQLSMAGRTYPTGRMELSRSVFPLEISNNWKYYRIHDYLALNPENYKKWLGEHSLVARIELLQAALTSHLLAFCQGAGYWLPERLLAEAVEVHGYKQVSYHGVRLLAFELTYRCNLSLPDEIALGKAVSHGFGVQRTAPKYRSTPF